MGKLASSLFLILIVVGIEYGRPCRPVVRLSRFVDMRLLAFHNYAQCYATIYGNGGWCRPNIFEPSGRDRRSGKTRPPARY